MTDPRATPRSATGVYHRSPHGEVLFTGAGSHALALTFVCRAVQPYIGRPPIGMSAMRIVPVSDSVM